ncbi:hypothetical protein N7448_011068 [Penicillium atrosanguineum]|uniref:Uncharacterized protein n=1 Tax=Penicillium atrosanguineum TaxID=1132637 RepID=A0A9W9GE31_9EURO|nr:uncharacterized protein N7443_009485 [Penicillium atrosanguineum]KAJ5117436.1 hypothetical protein N7448_011068 [Penicillium atrosanguineum]KAJ5126445.1 hypothetical protein N7526_008622 [Penicillium atrosanguineum]KAJ5293532.1 hypothetical protein N7443_009485 [Penicillium atrosanguineum]KAJ5302430.1 hypothetical protein N7476_009229 [Penicillium atrosanguineum]
MRFTATFLMLVTAIGGATAAPSAEPVEIQAREAGVDIKICNDTNLGGNCIDATVYAQHDCHSLNGSPVNQNVKSVSIPNGYRCRFWSSTVCNGGGTGDIQSPGNNDISSDRVSSVKCYAN